MSSYKQFIKLFSVNIKGMFREKQVWFWNIFFPVILMVIFMIIFGGGSNEFKAKVVLVEASVLESNERIKENLLDIPVFQWEGNEPVSLEQANHLILEKDIDAAIVLPSNADNAELKLIFNQENEQNATTQSIKGIINDFIQQTNWSVANVEPAFSVQTELISSANSNINYVDFLLTGMIALAIAQGGLFGMVEMVEMRKTGLLKRLKMTPVKLGLNGAAALLVRLLLAVIQIILLTLIGVFGFGANLQFDIPTFIIAFLIGVLAFNAIGYLISSFCKSIEAYMGIANIASFLMMFLSGIFFPTSGFPDWLVPVSNVLPLTYFVETLRDGMVYGSGFLTSQFWLGISILLAWGTVSYLFAVLIYRKAKIELR